ncbi:MAG: CPBP family intramembrane glutamic endopeptidase [Elusimicrobiota bacterium]
MPIYNEFLIIKIFFDVFIISFWLFVLFSNNKQQELISVFSVPLKKESLLYIFKILAFFLLVSIFSFFAENLVKTFGLSYEDEFELIFKSLSSSFFYVLYLGVVITGPISEELFFRKFLFEFFRKKINFWFSSIFVSLFFSVGHSSFLASFLYSMILCKVYESKKDLRLNFIIHILWNLIMLGVLFLLSLYAVF